MALCHGMGPRGGPGPAGGPGAREPVPKVTGAMWPVGMTQPAMGRILTPVNSHYQRRIVLWMSSVARMVPAALWGALARLATQCGKRTRISHALAWCGLLRAAVQALLDVSVAPQQQLNVRPARLTGLVQLALAIWARPWQVLPPGTEDWEVLRPAWAQQQDHALVE